MITQTVSHDRILEKRGAGGPPPLVVAQRASDGEVSPKPSRGAVDDDRHDDQSLSRSRETRLGRYG